MNRSARTSLVSLMAVLAGPFFISPAFAKVCKDEVSAKSRSAGQYSDTERESRARGNAVGNWRDRTRSTHGIAYRFWSRAEEKTVTCSPTKAAVTCVAKARPCRLL